MPSFYFEQLLQTGLNGIDQQGITAAVLQIAEVILILSLLWSVYEAYSNGGDVRLLGVAAVKYLVLGLVFLNYPSAFRAVNTMFNGVADGIYNLSGGLDAVQSWLNSLSQAWNSNPNWFSSSVELSYWRRLFYYCWANNAGRLLNSPLYLHPFHALLRPVRIDPVCGRTLCSCVDPIAGARPIGQNLLREHDDLPMLGPAVRNPAIADVGAADHRTQCSSTARFCKRLSAPAR